MKQTHSPLIGRRVRISPKSRYHGGEVGEITAALYVVPFFWTWYEVTFPTGARREFSKEQMEVLDADTDTESQ